VPVAAELLLMAVFAGGVRLGQQLPLGDRTKLSPISYSLKLKMAQLKVMNGKTTTRVSSEEGVWWKCSGEVKLDPKPFRSRNDACLGVKSSSEKNCPRIIVSLMNR
jgi:hypothetical protein